VTGEVTRHARRERAASPCDRRGAPLGALLRLFSDPGPRFRRRNLRRPSASSWREVRSDLQVEPRAARVRHACRPREPHLAPLIQDASGRRPYERGGRCYDRSPFL